MDEEKRGSSKRGAKIADLESGSLVVPPAQVMIMIRYKSYSNVESKIIFVKNTKKEEEMCFIILESLPQGRFVDSGQLNTPDTSTNLTGNGYPLQNCAKVNYLG